MTMAMGNTFGPVSGEIREKRKMDSEVIYTPIKQERLSEKIASQIKLLIIEGKIRPGERLPPERKLMEQLEVSRPSLREAIKTLTGMGLLEVDSGNRLKIRHLASKHVVDPFTHLLSDDIHTLYDLIEVRKGIETWNAYYAAQRATVDTDIPQLDKSISIMESLVNNDTSSLSDEDANFHMAIATATHNKIQMHMMFSMYDLLRKHICTHFEKISYQAIYEQHAKIVEEIKNERPEGAQQAMLTHLNYVEEKVREAMREKYGTDIKGQT